MKTKPHQLGLNAHARQMSPCYHPLSDFAHPSFSAQNPKGATIGGPLQNPWPPSNLASDSDCGAGILPACFRLSYKKAGKMPAPQQTPVFEPKTKGDQGIMIPLEISLIPFDRSTNQPPAILRQNQKDATRHSKKWRPLKKLASFRF